MNIISNTWTKIPVINDLLVIQHLIQVFTVYTHKYNLKNMHGLLMKE